MKNTGSGTDVLGVPSPEHIYTYITEGVREAMQALDAKADEVEDEDMRSKVVAGLGLMQAHMVARQQELKANAEWDTFTVAVYGETNAGKSTIIETLRILLNEPGKAEQRRAFQDLQATHGLNDTQLQETHVALETADGVVAQNTARLKALDAQAQVALEALQHEKRVAEQAAADAHAARPFWKKLLWFMDSAPDDTASREVQGRIEALHANENAQRQAIAQLKSDAEANAESAKSALDRYVTALPQLMQHADGCIIGDGRPDFTQNTQHYTFNSGGTPFVLLDVPGIEGGEAGVKVHIDNAVQIAHAVLYVTGKAARPQHGDKNEGTLEKIKRHLGAQTEVWAVFNKRVSSPMPLRDGANLFKQDADGMADLDAGLRAELPERYMGLLPISAYPAFLAVADCLPPIASLENPQSIGPDRHSARGKFLTEFDTAELLQKTGMDALANHLNTMAADAPRKIRQANVHKATQVLTGVLGQMEEHAKEMDAHFKRVKKQTTVAQGQVDLAYEQLSSSLDADAHNALRAFELGVRGETYRRIASDISNSDLESLLKATMESEAEVLKKDVGIAFGNSVETFKESLRSAAERFQKHLADLDQVVASQEHGVTGHAVTFQLQVSNGVSVPGLLATAAGAAGLLALGPGGWIVITFSVAGVLLSAFKALRGFFDSDVKKAQQRKAVDESLATQVVGIRESLKSSEETVLAAVSEACTQAKTQLSGPQRNLKAQSDVLLTATARLRALATRIQTTIA